MARRLDLRQAIVIGLGSMVGAGVFAVWAPAAAAAGSLLPLALALALVAATCNATSTAQLAAQTPTSGGTYVFGREHLGPWWGFAAGWCFVIGKTASGAAMALTFASYALPGDVPHVARGALAAAAVLVLTAISVRGITRTVRAATVLLTVVLLALALVLVTGWAVPADRGAIDALATHGASGASGPTWPPGSSGPGAGAPVGISGVLEAGGLLFFAFAGYARVATLGEEVRDPRRTIPRAVLGSLLLAALLYTALAATLLARLGPDALAGSAAPLRDLVATRDAGAWGPAVAVVAVLVAVGAIAACLGAVLSVLAGISRTMLAMAREGDLPRAFATVDPVHRVPARAQVAVAVVVALAVLVADLRTAVGFSSFGVLLYYAIANASAFRQARRHPEHARYPRALSALGVVLCVVLAFSVPLASVLAGAVVLAAGLAGRAVVARRR